ncbi:MAG: transporter [Frankiales bacterium]|nr:transporter [Frankiales bacterium]
MTVTAERKEIHPNAVLAIVLTAVFMNLLDVSIVNVAIPSIQKDLTASFAEIQLVLAGYQLAFACLLITGGRLGDIFGRRRLFIAGMSVFTLGSLACGLAGDATVLILSRVVQGVGAGLMVPQVLSTIQVTIPPKDRGRAFGLFGATIGIATILGPLVGGLLISADLFGTDWRMIFLVNIPVGLASVTAAARLLPETKAPDAPRLDIIGALVITVGLFLVVFPLTEGRERDWPAWLIGMLVAAAPVMAAFVVVQRRKTRENRSPLVLMTLFGNQSFRVGLVVSLVFFAGIPAFFFTFGLYLQLGLGFSALHAGLTGFPFALGTAIASSRSDKLAQRLGTNLLRVGAGLLSLSMVVLIAVVHHFGTGITSWDIAPFLLISGLGLGCFIAPLTNLILAGIKGREAGSASGVLTTGQQVGGALGIAIVGIVFFGLLSAHAPQAADAFVSRLPAPVTAIVPAKTFHDCFVTQSRAKDPSVTPAGCETPDGTPASVTAAVAKAAAYGRRVEFVYAFQRTLLYEVGIFALAALLVSFLPKVKPAGHAGPPGGE